MSGINRYESFVAAAYGGPYAAMRPSDSGNWVGFTEHEAEVARLRAEVELYKSLVRGVVENRHKCFIPTNDPKSSTFNWDERADAAMGESA